MYPVLYRLNVKHVELPPSHAYKSVFFMHKMSHVCTIQLQLCASWQCFVWIEDDSVGISNWKLRNQMPTLKWFFVGIFGPVKTFYSFLTCLFNCKELCSNGGWEMWISFEVLWKNLEILLAEFAKMIYKPNLNIEIEHTFLPMCSKTTFYLN